MIMMIVLHHQVAVVVVVVEVIPVDLVVIHILILIKDIMNDRINE